ncbi:hypothetical protein SAMN06298221_11295 [Sphaerochaeta associata]|nr:hypothetical protein SAMN06298221_11295 [Sphaerochaeta associata]
MYRQSWSEADRPWSTREANHFSAFIIRNHFLYPQDLTRSNIRNKVAFIRICFTRDMQECLETKIIQVAGQLRAAGLQSISFIHLMQIGYPKRPTSTTGGISFLSREKSDTLKADTYLGVLCMETQAVERLQEIHRLWLEIIKDSYTEYCAAFRSNKTMTSYIRSTVFELADRLSLLVQPEYYSLDYAFYSREDLVPKNCCTWNKADTIWLKRIRVAFEHENKLDGQAGGYQEFSHLLLTKADAKVLVGYGESQESYYPYALDYQKLMTNSDTDPVLFIGEYAPIAGVDDLKFESYLISSLQILKFDPGKASWGPMTEQ